MDKESALKLLGFPEELKKQIKKNRKKGRICDICEKEIRYSELYYCHDCILSYWVDHYNGFHISCLTKNKEAKKAVLEEKQYYTRTKEGNIKI